MTDERKIRALADESVLDLGPLDRGLGRAVRLQAFENNQIETSAGRDLLADSFHVQFGNPQGLEEVPADRALNKALIDWAADNPKFRAGREHTSGNIAASSAAAQILHKVLMSDEATREAMRAQSEAEAARKTAEAEEAQAQAMEQAAESGTGPAAEQMRAQARAARVRAESWRDQARHQGAKVQEFVDERAADAKYQAKVTAASNQAAEQGQETAELMAGWGMGPGSDAAIDPEAALRFLETVDSKIEQIAKVAGRVKGIASRVVESRVAVGHDLGELDRTQELTKIVPSELAWLRPDAPAEMRARKISDWAMGGLPGLTRAANGEESGPFVAAVDVSGSMGGNREIQAKGLALGLARQARQEGREYILFTFGSWSDPVFVVTSRDPWVRHLDWASKSRGGGTSFDKALTVSVEQIRELGDEVQGQADIVFFSDGEARVGELALEMWDNFREETGARLIYVPVAHSYMESSIMDLADETMEVGDLTQAATEDLAEDLAGRLF